MTNFEANHTFARRLRATQTDAERALWRQLRCKAIHGLRFRRQHPIGAYIVDFVCLQKRLVIELDGGQHNEEDGIVTDARRTEWLERSGYRIIRFWNNDVLQNMPGVLETIEAELDQDPPSKSPRGRSTSSSGRE